MLNAMMTSLNSMINLIRSLEEQYYYAKRNAQHDICLWLSRNINEVYEMKIELQTNIKEEQKPDYLKNWS